MPSGSFTHKLLYQQRKLFGYVDLICSTLLKIFKFAVKQCSMLIFMYELSSALKMLLTHGYFLFYISEKTKHSFISINVYNKIGLREEHLDGAIRSYHLNP